MKGSAFFHDSLADFDEICFRADPDLCFYKGLLDVGVQKKPWRQMLIFSRHLRFLGDLLREPRQDRRWFLREFSTVPLWFVCLFCRNSVSRLILFNHHNLQWALHRPANRWAFRRLQKWGAALVFFEFVPCEALESLGMTTENCFSIRHPVKPLRKRSVEADHTLGILGTWREDPQRVKMIRSLAERLDGRILIGAPNIQQAISAFPDNPATLTFVDTRETGEFHLAMQRCERLLLLYPLESHEYRASGLLSDAVANQVSVLIPDLPVLREQAQWPQSVGTVYPADRLEEELILLLNQAPKSERSAFALHAECRSVDRLADELATILEMKKHAENS